MMSATCPPPPNSCRHRRRTTRHRRGLDETVDRVGQPADANLLEQARRHAATIERRQHAERVIVRIAIADAFEPEHEVELLERPLDPAIAAGITSGQRCRSVRVAHAAEQIADAGEEIVVIDAARCRHDRALRAVMALHVAGDLGASEPRDDLGPAEHRPAERLIGIGGLRNDRTRYRPACLPPGRSPAG
jgi:hypothetical protein